MDHPIPQAASQTTHGFPPDFLPDNPAWHTAAVTILKMARGALPGAGITQALAESITNTFSAAAPRHDIIEWLLKLALTEAAQLPCAAGLANAILSALPAPAAMAQAGAVLHEDAQLPRGVKEGDVPKPKWSQPNSEWFKDLELYFRMHGPITSDAHKLYLAVQASSQNRSLYTRLKLIQSTKPHATWSEVKKDILDSMYEKDATKTARDRLAGLRQGNLSAEEYVSKFEMYCFEATDVSEAEKCDRFMRQMDPGLQREIMKAGDPKTYEEMRSMATRIDGRRRNPKYGRGDMRDNNGCNDSRSTNHSKGNYSQGSRFNPDVGHASASLTKDDGPQPMDLNYAGNSKPPARARLTFEEKKMYDAKGWCKYCRAKDHTVESCKVKPSKPLPPKAMGPRQR